MNGRIVVTGIGPVTSLGIGKDAVWSGLQRGPDPITSICQCVGQETWETYPLATVIGLDLANFGIGEQELAALTGQQANRDLALFFAASCLALDDSGLRYEKRNNRVGVVCAHENPGIDEYTRQIWEGIASHHNGKGNDSGPLATIKELFPLIERAGYYTHSFVLLQQVTRLLQLHGPALMVNNACASGLYALEAASSWLRAGQADAMVVVCGDSPRVLARYHWLRTAKACNADGVMRPFDKFRSGFTLGEGAGAILIETLESARSRGAHVYAEYRAGSFRSDGWKLSAPCISPNFYREAVQEVLELGNIRPEDVDLVIPHGAATPIQDRYEAEGITQVFGKNSSRPFITALKPYVGHTLAGSSVIELILALISISHDVIPPTLNWTTLDAKLCLQPVTSHTPYKVKTWLKTATGFGGFNAACLFSKPQGDA